MRPPPLKDVRVQSHSASALFFDLTEVARQLIFQPLPASQVEIRSEMSLQAAENGKRRSDILFTKPRLQSTHSVIHQQRSLTEVEAQRGYDIFMMGRNRI